MAKTAQMRLVELMVLKQDITNVIAFLGKKGNFQFQSGLTTSENSSGEVSNREKDLFSKLDQSRAFLGTKDFEGNILDVSLPTPEDFALAEKIISSTESLSKRCSEQSENVKRAADAYKEAKSFANLKASYSELEHLSFLSMKIGKIDPAVFDELKFAAGTHAIIVKLGDDGSKILAVSSKKGRFALDTQLKKFGFVGMEISKDFKGVPDDVLEGLEKQKNETAKLLAEIETERKNYAETHSESIVRLLASFSLASQVRETETRLESTQLVYRLTGWIPLSDCAKTISEIDNITESRCAIREYNPSEIPSVASGHEKVPVQLQHGKFVSSFKRMIFSYGSPVYGSIDPTPFVAVFFTLLFGIMFGDAGQGLVFLLIGILLATNVVKVGGWNKFAPIFMAIGISSMIMGLLTGEFFASESVLRPFERWVTGLFGESRDQILPMMPQSNPESIKRMFLFFAFTVTVGFVINTCGLIINVINNISRKHWGEAFFGKSGLAGALFFWYVIIMVVRVFLFKNQIALYDWIIIAITLFFAAFGEPFERMVDKKKPVLENGLGSAIISGVVEIIEVVSGYLSNTVSFLRVGAFAIAHAVLGYIILTMTELVGGVGGIAVSILGNAIVVVLEGMIVAIQVVRLQYYEFFSKFFGETGKEFKPFSFQYKESV